MMQDRLPVEVAKSDRAQQACEIGAQRLDRRLGRFARIDRDDEKDRGRVSGAVTGCAAASSIPSAAPGVVIRSGSPGWLRQ